MPCTLLPEALCPGNGLISWDRGEVEAAIGRKGGFIRLTGKNAQAPSFGEQGDPASCVPCGFQAGGGLFFLQSLGQTCISPEGCGLGNVLI